MNDVTYIKQAVKLAGLDFGLTSPWAMVGAVLVKNGEIVGEGFYTYDGVRHAEIIALEQAGEAARGATVYTSLEPCSHQGRTGPCARALVDAGVTRVVTAMQDANPEVNGHGLAMLRAGGRCCGSFSTAGGAFPTSTMRLYFEARSRIFRRNSTAARSRVF